MFHKIVNLINEKNEKRRPLFIFCLIIFFFVLFDGIIYYTAPIIITESGISDTVMGFIIASSSIAGAIFDLILCRFFKNPNFRRLMLAMFILATIYPIVIYHSKTVFWFVVAMALWGFYYDLFNLSKFDFVSRIFGPKENASGFGVMAVFESLGYLIAPIVAVFLIGLFLAKKVALTSLFPLFLSVLFFLVLLSFVKNHKNVFRPDGDYMVKRSFYHEIILWFKLSKKMLPVLVVSFLLNVTHAFFWTIGPLFSSSYGFLGGLFLFVYGLPWLLTGWFVGKITRYIGKKMSAIISLFLGSLTLFSFFFLKNFILVLPLTFIAAIFISFVWPSINSAYTDYISESPVIGEDIEAVQDYFTNMGYIIGPAAAGILSDRVGHLNTFATLGLVGVIAAIFLFIFTPKQIDVTNIS